METPSNPASPVGTALGIGTLVAGRDLITGEAVTGGARVADLLPTSRSCARQAAGDAKRFAGGCGCFEEGALVATPDGLVPIETIKVGALVMSKNEVTGEVAPKPVTDPQSIVDYYNESGEFELIGYVHGIVTVRPSGSDKIMFSYSKDRGITAVYFDYQDSGVLKDRGGGLGVDRVAAEKVAFLPKGSKPILACDRP